MLCFEDQDEARSWIHRDQNMVEVLVLNQFCAVTPSPIGSKVRIVVCVLDNVFVLFIKSCFLVARLGEDCFRTTLALGVCKLHGVQLFLRIIYRVIGNDCRGFNNLLYTIHLR